MDLLFVVALPFVLALLCLCGAVTTQRFRLAFGIATFLLLLVGAGLVHVLFAGGVIVVDRDGQLKGAALGHPGDAAPMRVLPLGLYYGEPPGEGAILLTCQNGTVHERGYVTRGFPMIEHVEPDLC